MILAGRPDFQHPLRAEGLTMWAPFEGAGPHRYLAERLEIARRPDGRPDVRLEIVGPVAPGLPPDPYGRLDLRVRAPGLPEEALARLRSERPSATAAPVIPRGGSLWMRLAGGGEDLDAALGGPRPIAWNGLGVARCDVVIPIDVAELLRRALSRGEVLLLQAACAIEVAGVAPRVPGRVRVEPRRVLGALLSRADAGRRLPWEDVVGFFAGDPAALPLQILDAPPEAEGQGLAEALADRLIALHGEHVMGNDGLLRVEWPDPGAVDAGTLDMDLSRPAAAVRAFSAALHPLEAAREIVNAAGIDAVVHKVVVPPLAAGSTPVRVSANLPPARRGAAALGVSLEAPPRPPGRMHTIREALRFEPPEDGGSLELGFAPGEAPEFTARTFAVLQRADRGALHLEGPPRRVAARALLLSPDDFPVRFIPLEASPNLLALAEVRVTCRRREAEREVIEHFTLHAAQPAICLVLPAEAEGATLEIEARALRGGSARSLGPMEAEPLSLDLPSFADYGPQEIEVACDPAPGAGEVVAIEIALEGEEDRAEAISVLHFTAARPRRVFRWFAASPFASGVRFRRRAAPGEVTPPWSEVRPRTERLIIEGPRHAAPAPREPGRATP